MKLVMSVVTVVAFAGVASAAIIPINDAIDSFEFVDLANTITPTNGQSIVDSDAWTLVADVNTAVKPRQYVTDTHAGGAFTFNGNPKNAGDLLHLQSATIGYSLVDAQEYQFSIDQYRASISGAPEWVFEVYTADNNLLGSITNAVSAKNTWQTFSGTFTVGAADAGKDVYFKVLRDSTIGTMIPKGGNVDNIVLQTIPEPATLGLIAAFGGGIILIRRIFMM